MKTYTKDKTYCPTRQLNMYIYIVAISLLQIRNFELNIVNTYLSTNLNMCFGYSKELSHQDNYFEYPKHVLVEK